ncbi:cytochrome P450 [Striga asiatica]|uniref:Cytochrome P450 n=1 Tax=Striga asiatica TaxID=4170 RepID=A0A5A7PEQ7_STRAF|nr:cytochrome P450 [Striga asiatica]
MGGEQIKDNSPVQQCSEAVEFDGTMKEGRLLAIRWALHKTWKAKCLDIYWCLDDKTLSRKLCTFEMPYKPNDFLNMARLATQVPENNNLVCNIKLGKIPDTVSIDEDANVLMMHRGVTFSGDKDGTSFLLSRCRFGPNQPVAFRNADDIQPNQKVLVCNGLIRAKPAPRQLILPPGAKHVFKKPNAHGHTMLVIRVRPIFHIIAQLIVIRQVGLVSVMFLFLVAAS